LKLNQLEGILKRGVKSKMFSLLGSHIDYKGYIFKPFYLLLGALCFIVLLSLLASLYIFLFIRNTLEDVLNNIDKNRNKYSRMK